MNKELSPEAIDAVLESLARSDFKWRTVAGVAEETGLTPEIVQQAISQVADRVVRSSIPSADGRDLYTTREHFRESASLSEKLLGSIKNRVI